MRRALAVALSASMVWLGACAHPTRPPVMADASREAESPAAREAALLAPEAHAHAEKLRRDADAAWAAGDLPGAQVLSERALAAYQHALVLARIVRANRAATEATASLAKAQEALAKNEADLARVAAEADDVEMRIRVARDAAPLARSSPADPAREAARLAAARSLATDARLLCVSVRMLTKEPPPALADAEGALAKLDALLAKPPRPAPVDEAARARARCLDLLTRARRDAIAASSTGSALSFVE
jgi:hypothetical protein